jgi:hypothetical protein
VTLPAHRFRDREERKKNDEGPKVFVCDFDETITTAPKLIAYLSKVLRDAGDKFYVLTGNDSPRDELLQRLNDYDVSFDDLIQYSDSQSDGIARAHYLKQLDAYCGIDNRIDRAGTYVQACPHLFVMSEPPKIAEENAHGSKKAAKKAAKKVDRSEQRSEVSPPPNLRESTSTEDEQPEHECGTCRMYDEGVCWGYGNWPVDGEWVCDSWELDPNWQEQDAAQDAADDTSTP